MSKLAEKIDLTVVRTLDLRQNSRALLFKLTSVFGSTVLLVFGIDNVLMNWAPKLGFPLIAFAVVGYINYWTHRSPQAVVAGVRLLNALIPAICFTLVFTGGYEKSGLFWIFPLALISLAMNGYLLSKRVAAVVVIGTALLLLTPLNEYLEVTYSYAHASRFMAALAASVIVALFTLRSLDSAFHELSALHVQDVRSLSSTDWLTGAHNASSLYMFLRNHLNQPGTAGSPGLLYVSVSNFRLLGQIFGNNTRERILVEVGHQLSQISAETLSSDDKTRCMARLHTGDFVIATLPSGDLASLMAVATAVEDRFRDGVLVDGRRYAVLAGIGVIAGGQSIDDAEVLVNCAGEAALIAKGSVKSRIVTFTPEIETQIRNRQVIESSLRESIDSGYLELVFMPTFRSADLKVVGCEALLRCKHPNMTGIGPDQFIPIAESTGLIHDIDQWVMNEALARLATLQQLGFAGTMAINVSAAELQNENYPRMLKDCLRLHGINPATLECEITETALVADDARGLQILREIKALGVKLSLDDFGTGYTAFTQLMNYPVDILKIDRSFTNAINSDDSAKHQLVNVMQTLAEIYKLKVIAEGVETDAQLVYLQSQSCQMVQGYLLSKPLPFDAFRDLAIKNAA